MLDIQAEQHEHGQPQRDLYEAVLDIKRRHDLHPCSVSPRDGLALRRDSVREQVQDLVARFRALPEEQRRRLPALLNSLAQLEVVVGDLEASQHDFQEVATLVSDPISRAEAFHNVYRAALERRDYDEALNALRRAVALDADAFEPFPFTTYQPLRILGCGGFGPSFLCQEEAGNNVVLRALRPDSLDRGIDALFRDVRIIQEIDHPALARIRAFGEVGPSEEANETTRPYLVLEHFDGITLSEHVAQNGPLAPEDWLQIAWPLARALQSLHGRGVLHRSLRPGSILLRRDKTEAGTIWAVKVLDTGLCLKRALIHASASSPEARVQTSLGRSVARTLAYAPSEVVGRPKGQVWVGPHSDVYSFGRASAFALTGRPEPDNGDLLLLAEPWRQLLTECCAWTVAGRLAHMGLVLERLSRVPGSEEIIGKVERVLYESTIADHTAALALGPRAGTYINRGNAHARQGDFEKAIADFAAALELQPEDAGIYRRRGLAHARNGNLEQAIADYSEALRLEPRNAEALANRGLAYSQSQRLDLAIADYTEGLRISARDEALFYNRGNAYYLQGDLERAIADYTEAIRLNPRGAWALGNRGKAHALRGDHARAIADYTRVLQLDPVSLRALCDRAASHAAVNRHDRAIADYTEALRLSPGPGLHHDRGLAHNAAGNYEAAIADFTEVLNSAPDQLGARLARGNAHAALNQFDLALADYDEVIRRQPDSPSAHLQRGNLHAQRGDQAAAILDFNEALRLQPDYTAAYFNRGNAHAEAGDHDAALADFSEVLRLSPRDAAAHTNRGNAHANLGDLDAALEDYGEALALDPADTVALCNRAAAHMRRGDTEAALADYSEAIRLGPPTPSTYNGRGAVYAERGELERAIADFGVAIKLAPDSARAYHNRANAHAEKGDLDRAIADFGEVIRLAPDHPIAHYNRGHARAEKGDLDGAIADFTEALRLQPGHGGAYNNRGNVRLRIGDREGALADFSAAIAADPSSSHAYYNRANVACDQGDYAQAVADYSAALRLAPDDVSAYLNRGRAYTLLGDYARALQDNLAAQELAPDDPRVSNNLAWLWATCPLPQLRDGPRAKETARAACESTGWADPGHLDTLAAACAACGEFAEAAQWQRKAIELAPEGERDDYRERLALYEAGKPYIQGAG